MTRWIQEFRNEPFVFGLCLAVSRQGNCSVWLVRLVAVLALLMWPVTATLAYVALAVIAPATRAESLEGLAEFGRWIGQVCRKLYRLARLRMTNHRARRDWEHRYWQDQA